MVSQTGTDTRMMQLRVFCKDASYIQVLQRSVINAISWMYEPGGPPPASKVLLQLCTHITHAQYVEEREGIIIPMPHYTAVKGYVDVLLYALKYETKLKDRNKTADDVSNVLKLISHLSKEDFNPEKEVSHG